VVVVGNLSVGGTGKTPLVGWLAARLAERGLHPGVVTRGYGGTLRGERLVTPEDDPAVVGDEAVLLARRLALPVAAGRNRAAAAQRLVDFGCDVIVSDDGLQHTALGRDCEILVIDGERGFGNGRLLPAGPLREPITRLGNVDAVVVNGGGEGVAVPGVPPGAGPPAFRMRLEASRAVALAAGPASASLHGAERPLASFAGTSVHAVAGIGNPDRFFAMLRAQGMAVRGHALADHARIAAGDILFADAEPVLMTEKDAVKCGAGSRGAGGGGAVPDARHWYVPVDVRFTEAAAAALLEIVMGKITAAAPARNTRG
jgi:tetraacyldisaccharide 4'-kinase